jgi:hypothetical protein
MYYRIYVLSSLFVLQYFFRYSIVCVIPIPIMAKQQIATIVNANRSEVENVPDIEALASRVQSLSQSVDWWNAAMIWALIFAAIAAVAVVITTRKSILRTGELGAAQSELAQAKDATLQQALNSSRERIVGLEKDASDAKADMARQQTRAATAEMDLLQLQTRLAHRRINPSEQAKLVAKLLPYPGSIVAVTRLGEAEAGQFADDLLAVFSKANWEVKLARVGVIAPPQYGVQCVVDTRSKAGRALADVLRELPNVEIHEARRDPPHDVIIGTIIVGLKPPA